MTYLIYMKLKRGSGRELVAIEYNEADTKIMLAMLRRQNPRETFFADAKAPFTREATNGNVDLCDAIRKKAIATLNVARENLTLAKVDAMAWRIWHQDYPT